MLARARRALRDEIALADTNSQERADEKIEEALRTSGAIADAET
jgi:RNA polymerase-interacting CarD/CdnL/TRCF family regulator